MFFRLRITSCLFSLCTLLLATVLLSGTAHANIIVNGDFEGGINGSGHPEGWSTWDADDGSITVIPQNSPFPPGGSQSVLMQDGPGGDAQPRMEQTFGPLTGTMLYQTDFHLADANNSWWNIRLISENNTAATHIKLQGGLFQIRNGADWETIAINSDTWYHIEMTLNTDDQTYNVSLYEDGVATPVSIWSDLDFVQGATDIGRLQIRDWSSNQGSAFTIDNVSLVVPEPGSLALVGLGGALMVLRPRRKA